MNVAHNEDAYEESNAKQKLVVNEEEHGNVLARVVLLRCVVISALHHAEGWHRIHNVLINQSRNNENEEGRNRD